MKPNSVMAMALMMGVVGVGDAAHAQLDEIVGDALTVEVTAGSRTGSVAIPRTQLVPGDYAEWRWTSPAPVNVLASDGTFLGSFSGRVSYNWGFDNIDFALTFRAGATDSRFTVRSADLTNSFTDGGDNLTVMAFLNDQNNNGATLTGLLGGFFTHVEWNAQVQMAGLNGFSAPVGGTASRFEELNAPGVPYTGTKVLRSEFSLTAGDLLNSTVHATTSIPTPGASCLLLGVGAMVSRRRRV